MGRVIVHAGMPKAGSSAIQAWLMDQVEDPTAPCVPVRAVPAADRVVVTTSSGESMNSGHVIHLLRDTATVEQAAATLVSGLERAAEADDRPIVVSGEALAQVVWMPIRPLLDRLEDLAGRHEVRIVYYVRPQHTALEAAWRQWGFRTGSPPATYLRDRAGAHHRYRYHATLVAFEAITQRVPLLVRGFRPDLLVGGDVVVDFATIALGTTVTPPASLARQNVGLSLDLTNALQGRRGLLDPDQHANTTFNLVKDTLRNIEPSPSAGVTEGRRVLQAWCHEQFAQDNAALADRLGWPDPPFVPPVDPPARPELGVLDDLWAPAGAPEVIAALHAALDRVSRMRQRIARLETEVEQTREQARARRLELQFAVDQRDEARADLAALKDRRSVRIALRMAGAVAPMVRRARRPPTTPPSTGQR